MFAQAVANISIWVGAIGPTVLAGCTFTGGVVLLFSNAMPVSDARLRLVETVLPLTVVETSHFIGSIDGVLLLLSAYGIQQRLRWAWALSAVLTQMILPAARETSGTTPRRMNSRTASRAHRNWPVRHRRAKTDRLDTELLKRGFLGWLRGSRDTATLEAWIT